MDFFDKYLSEIVLGSGGVITSLIAYVLGKKERDNAVALTVEDIHAKSLENLQSVVESLRSQCDYLTLELQKARCEISKLNDELKYMRNLKENELQQHNK